jgi:hypothetical protein
VPPSALTSLRIGTLGTGQAVDVEYAGCWRPALVAQHSEQSDQRLVVLEAGESLPWSPAVLALLRSRTTVLGLSLKRAEAAMML